MVFNDTIEILNLFHDILSSEGHEVSINTYGTLELPLVQSYQPDLIIADFPPVVREERGWQLLQKLKMTRETENIPLIVCTTNLRALHNSEGWLASKNILAIPKPFTIDELLVAIDTQLRTLDDANPAIAQLSPKDREV
jgi:DNA-binding response OmpR family regulator